MSRWKSLRHRLERLGVELLAWAIPRLSRRTCVRLGNALGTIAYLADARGRAVALGNLECAFGDRLTAKQRRELARASYRNFLRTMLDLFWAQNLTRENWRAWMQPEGFEELRDRLAREQRGTIFMCVHQGNWGWANPAGATLQEIAQRCWDAFVPVLHARPHLWLWPYKHFRYKPGNSTRDYPFYAHESGKFEKLLRQSASGVVGDG